MSRLKLNMFACVFVALLVVLLSETEGADVALAKIAPLWHCGIMKIWKIIPSPNPGNPSFLHGVASVPGTDHAWAVGEYLNSDADYESLIEHWNGTNWNVFPSPRGGSTWTFLEAVVATSARDAWAVGETPDQPVIERWDGTRWRITPSPVVQGASLYSVASVSANDVWVVGEHDGDTLIEHWNGKTWRIISSPEVNDSKLFGVASVSSKDVWAVGSYSKPDFKTQTLIEHWDGASWQIVRSPSPGTANNELKSVTRVPGTSQIWAAGNSLNLGFQHNKTLIEHWDGANWRVIPSPNTPGSSNLLHGVAAVSDKNVWAVGTQFDTSSRSRQDVNTLTEQWDGTLWRIIPSANSRTDFSFLYGVAITSTNNIWAVGNLGNGRTLIEHYC